ncbi:MULTISPECIES: S8 family peptidase [unclassified Meiothermus]|uniref:S8 family peptidase n=1 Tax=unclassified Meiothermus TaxID=370471 RepID=UPI000D7BCD92|nr:MULTISPECIES: S8 family peptidase [unclassified Meiothermus]PZA07325.1 peptidase S8 [Meiothermus sp. Pnk-1]RYM37318.1 peptidase S8 [Meiothermus sp. PNK-Is4]
MYARWLLGGILLTLLTACPRGGSGSIGGGSGNIGGTVSLGSSITGQRLQIDPQPSPLRRTGEARFIPGEVLVEFQGGVSLQSVSSLRLEVQGRPVELQQVRPLGLPRTALYRADVSEAETPALLAALRSRSDVASADLNWLEQPLAAPNDEYYDLQWHYSAINLPQAWDRTTGSNSVVVAILDTGVLFSPSNTARSHPDIDSRLVPGYDMVSPISGADPFANAGDGDGRDPDPYDVGDEQSTHYHGTHVGGTVGAATNNNQGVAGVDWSARLLHVRVIGLLGATVADQVDAILWAAGEPVPGLPTNANPAKVINMSLGGKSTCTTARQNAINLVTGKGVVVVVAAGNENDDASLYSPASCANVITVGATDYAGARAPYSNYGARVDVMAPGGDVSKDLNNDGYSDGVLSLGFDDQTKQFNYKFLNGTSMAAPHVAGVVALMKALSPNLDTAQALQILKSTARPLTATQCSRPSGNDCGAGLIDANAALAAVQGGTVSSFSLSTTNTILTAQPGGSVNVPITISRSGGFSGAVSLSLQGAPTGVSGSFNPANTSSNDSTLTLNVAASVPNGTYALTVRGTSGSTFANLPLSLRVGSGTNASVQGTVVLACYIAQGDCDPSRSKAIQIDQGGTSASYAIADLTDGDYAVLGWKDLNNNKNVDQGDYLGGVVDNSGNLAAVRPGNLQANFQLDVLSDNLSRLTPDQRRWLEQARSR